LLSSHQNPSTCHPSFVFIPPKSYHVPSHLCFHPTQLLSRAILPLLSSLDILSRVIPHLPSSQPKSYPTFTFIPYYATLFSSHLSPGRCHLFYPTNVIHTIPTLHTFHQKTIPWHPIFAFIPPKAYNMPYLSLHQNPIPWHSIVAFIPPKAYNMPPLSHQNPILYHPIFACIPPKSFPCHLFHPIKILSSTIPPLLVSHQYPFPCHLFHPTKILSHAIYFIPPISYPLLSLSSHQDPIPCHLFHPTKILSHASPPLLC
jgi:hypothetical protein